MLSELELTKQLYALMTSIPLLWNWSQLEAMLLEHESHVEYRGSKANFISFEISVLEKGKKEEDLYLHVLVSVTDPERKSYTRGSSNTPLTTSFLFYENGEHDMPLEREIHEREY